MSDTKLTPEPNKTPETDAEIVKNEGKVMSVSSQFARQLERRAIAAEQMIEQAHKELKDIPIGNEHEIYSLARRCEIAIHVKQFAWNDMDKTRAERDALKKQVESLQALIQTNEGEGVSLRLAIDAAREGKE